MLRGGGNYVYIYMYIPRMGVITMSTYSTYVAIVVACIHVYTMEIYVPVRMLSVKNINIKF